MKDMLKDIEIDEFCRLALLDIKSLYPKVPVKQALECTQEALQADATLKDQTDWAIDDNEIIGDMHRNTFQNR